MTRRRILLNLLAVLGVSPVWAIRRGHAMGARQDRSVAVTCTGAGDARLHADLCDILREGLKNRYPDTAFFTDGTPAPLTLTLIVDTATKSTLNGRLAWSGRATGQGADVTSGTSDAAIGTRQHEMFISALLKISRLPL